jgi:hypothetical protein
LGQLNINYYDVKIKKGFLLMFFTT